MNWLRSTLAAACLLTASAALAAFHLFTIDQIFSNADGTVQFIVLTCPPPPSCFNGENSWAGFAAFTSTHGGTTKTFTASSNLPSSTTAGRKVLVATPGFAALGLVAPDYTIASGFLPTDSGTIAYSGGSSITYNAGQLPTDGTNALYIDGSIKTNLATNFAGASASVTVAGPPGAAVNYQGLWWATGGTEAFWGINFAHSGDQVFGTWYTYDTSGKAWWLSMLANRTTGNTYTGKIYVDIGPPFDNFVGMGTATEVGNGTLTFSDSNNGTFHYDLNAGTGGSPVLVSQIKAIERYNLGTGPQPTCTFSPGANLALATNYQDLWWAASGVESGWGINFAHQGDSVFLTWYTYDSGGAPLWLSALTQRQGTTNVYTGSLLRTSGPRFDNYKASDVVLPIPTVGTATLTFANGNSATFNYTTSGNGGLPAGVNQTKSIVRFPITAGGTVCN